MLHARTVRPAGSFAQADDEISLDHDGRHRRRIQLTTKGGTRFLLDLAQATALQEGDGLELEDGRIVRVRAEPEALMQVTAGSPELLMRLVWHIGNRHLAAEITASAVLIRPDHVIADMLRALGATVTAVTQPFLPEGGAYAAGGHGHAHSHAESHAHGHAHSHSHSHSHSHDHDD